MKRYLQPFILLSLLWTLFAASICFAGGGEQRSALIQRTLQSSLMHRGWESKSYSEKKPHDWVTVITTPGLDGDIIILRWNGTRTQFQTELYHQDEGPGLMKSWESAIGSIDKSIVQQPGGTLHVFEKVSGPDGGQLVEVITLDK